MKKYIGSIIISFVIVSMLLSACASTTVMDSSSSKNPIQSERNNYNSSESQSIISNTEEVTQSSGSSTQNPSQSELNSHNSSESQFIISNTGESSQSISATLVEEDTTMLTTQINVQVDGYTFTATLENNSSAQSFVSLIRNSPLTIQMKDYSGFEKIGSLGTTLPTNDQQTTTQSGDIVLYGSSQIVMFYGSNSWSYTRLAKIDNLSDWQKALQADTVSVTFSVR